MKNNHTQLKRLAAISLVMVMCLSSLAVLAPSASAHMQLADGYMRGNTSEQIGWLELFRYDFERDPIGDTLIADYYARPSANWTLETVTHPDNDHGRVLMYNRSGGVDTSWQGGFYTGHQFTSVFRFSFDTYIDDINKVAGEAALKLLLGPDWLGSAGHQPEFRIGKDSSKAYIRMSGETTHVAAGEWHHCDAIIDLDNLTVESYIDGALVATIPLDVSWDSIGFVRFRTSPDSNDRQVTVYLDNISVAVPMHTVQAMPSMDPSPSLSIMFDDGLANTYEVARPILGDLPAVMPVVTDWVGNTGRVTWAQVSELHAAGWEIMSHSMSHPDMTTLTEAEARAEFEGSRQAILDNTGIHVRGWVYPSQESSLQTDRCGWDYYEYLAGTKYDITRHRIYATSADEQYHLDKFNAGLVYARHAHICVYTHQVDDTGATGRTNRTAFANWVAFLKAYNIDVVTPSEAYPRYRNAFMAEVSGDATEFSIGYGSTYHNYATSDVYVRISGHPDGDYVVCRSDGDYTHATSVDGEMICQLDAGEYRVMTLADFRQDQVDRAFEPLYAAIPVVVMLAVIGGLFTMVGRLKF